MPQRDSKHRRTPPNEGVGPVPAYIEGTRSSEKQMRAKFRTLCLVGLSVGAFAACSSLGSLGNIFGSGTQAVTGNYTLRTVNGQQLPYTFSQNGSTTTIQSDYYALNTDNTYVETTSETVSNGLRTSNVTQTERGNWSQSNNGYVTFQPTYSTQGVTGSYSATLSGGGILGGGTTLTIAANGATSVYSQ